MSRSDLANHREQSTWQQSKPKPREPLARMTPETGLTASPPRINSFSSAKKHSRRSNSVERMSSDDNDFEESSSEDKEMETSSSFVDENSSYGSNNYSTDSLNRYPRRNSKRVITKSKTTRTEKKQNNADYSPESMNPTHRRSDSSNTSSYTLCFIAALFILILAYCGWPAVTNSSETMAKDTRQEDIKESKINILHRVIEDVKRDFHEQKSDIWDEIVVGIKEIIDYPEKHSILLFFADNNNTVVRLAELVGHKAKDVLDSEVKILNPKDLEHNTGNVLTMLKSMIRKSKIVVIHDLLNINSEALKALHSVCDSENPLVKGSMYLLTMMTREYSNKDALAFVEDELNRTFSKSINQDILQPLITRITGGAVFPIQPESNVLRS